MPDRSRSLKYLPLIGTYAAFTGGTALAIRRSHRRVAEPRLTDVVLLGLATFKLSRLVTKAKVTQPLREPFVTESEPGAEAEINSTPEHSGVRGAVGELLTCPFCISVWIATALTAMFAVAPRAVRLITSGLAGVALADSSQYAYSSLRQAAD